MSSIAAPETLREQGSRGLYRAYATLLFTITPLHDILLLYTSRCSRETEPKPYRIRVTVKPGAEARGRVQQCSRGANDFSIIARVCGMVPAG